MKLAPISHHNAGVVKTNKTDCIIGNNIFWHKSKTGEIRGLGDNAKVCVIGGGPAGSFFSYFLLESARKLGLRINLTIYDSKSFSDIGPAGCNMCAGTLGTNLLKLLSDAGYTLPPAVVRHEVKGYTFHFKNKSVQLWQEPDEKIITVFRGMGPYPKSKDKLSFDQYLLDCAREKGAGYIQEDVSDITKKLEEADLAAGAFGVNSSLSKRMPFGYVPPKTWHACQAEIEAGYNFIERNLRHNIHIFNIADPVIKFAALVPKENFISVSVIGRHIRIRDLENVLRLPEFKDYLPKNWHVRCHCHPKIPITPARHPWNDKLIMIGDACNSRYLKNGIESAFQTAKLAADVVLNKGISGDIIYRHYYKKCMRVFNADNRYGKFLFGMNDIIRSHPYLAGRFIDFTIKEKTSYSPDYRITSKVLWNMFTGSIPYKDILKKAMHPKLLLNMVPYILFHHPQAAYPMVADRIAVIGGGPAGASCAIKLLLEAKGQAKEIKVFIYEGKDFKRHYNQCVGVLSPPLEEVLNKKLGIELPEELIKRTVYGYKVHGDKKELILSETGQYHTYTVRRVEFDKFLLDYAISKGAELINSRVTNIELLPQEVRIYSESGYNRVDAVVVASGVDSAMLHELANVTKGTVGFQPPTRYMQTIITKIHADPGFIKNIIGDYVHAFILSNLPNIEFGAITPKGDHIIINIAGSNISSLDMDMFLKERQVNKFLPEIDFDKLEYFKGKFPTGSARNPYGDRFAAVGDVTGWLRPFKGKGINTAVITGIRAAETILRHGISRDAFINYERECKNLTEAYRFGIAARFLLGFCKRTKTFDPILDLAKMDLELYDILYQCISGETLYREIFKKLSSPRLLLRIIFNVIWKKL